MSDVFLMVDIILWGIGARQVPVARQNKTHNFNDVNANKIENVKSTTWFLVAWIYILLGFLSISQQHGHDQQIIIGRLWWVKRREVCLRISEPEQCDNKLLLWVYPIKDYRMWHLQYAPQYYILG